MANFGGKERKARTKTRTSDMVNVDIFVGALKSTGVDFFTGVPDSLLKSFCAYVTDTCGDNHVIAANRVIWTTNAMLADGECK